MKNKKFWLAYAQKHLENFTIEETKECLIIRDRHGEIAIHSYNNRGECPIHPETTFYDSWEEFLEKTTEKERLLWCSRKAIAANSSRKHFYPKNWDILKESVFQDFMKATYKRRYSNLKDFYKNSSITAMNRWDNWSKKYWKQLDVNLYQASIKINKFDVWSVLQRAKGRCYHCGELALSKRTKGDWEWAGSKIGTLDHLIPLSKGGDNNPENLVWSCFSCNMQKNSSINAGGV